MSEIQNGSAKNTARRVRKWSKRGKRITPERVVDPFLRSVLDDIELKREEIESVKTLNPKKKQEKLKKLEAIKNRVLEIA